eukprot:4979477-Ditylum_brightwellii.AAC.1
MIQLNHVILNNLCKPPESWFDMVEVLLGGKALHHWQQFKPQVMNLLILDVFNEDDKDSNGEEEYDKEKKKKDEGQSFTSAGTSAVISRDTYSSSVCKFMHYYFVNHQFDAKTQKHYLWSYL